MHPTGHIFTVEDITLAVDDNCEDKLSLIRILFH